MRERRSFVTWLLCFLRSVGDILWRPYVRLEPLDPLALAVLQAQALPQGAQAFQALSLQCIRDLRVLLDTHRRGEPIDPLKTASLAGLLSRRGIMGDAATRARALAQSGIVRGPTLADVERLPVIPQPAQREALRVLFAADELGAAVAFAGCPKKVAVALRRRMDEIMATMTPEVWGWKSLAPLAREYLASAPISEDDPAERLWSALAVLDQRDRDSRWSKAQRDDAELVRQRLAEGPANRVELAAILNGDPVRLGAALLVLGDTVVADPPESQPEDGSTLRRYVLKGGRS